MDSRRRVLREEVADTNCGNVARSGYDFADRATSYVRAHGLAGGIAGIGLNIW